MRAPYGHMSVRYHGQLQAYYYYNPNNQQKKRQKKSIFHLFF
jgi:hypothetical protein